MLLFPAVQRHRYFRLKARAPGAAAQAAHLAALAFVGAAATAALRAQATGGAAGGAVNPAAGGAWPLTLGGSAAALLAGGLCAFGWLMGAAAVEVVFSERLRPDDYSDRWAIRLVSDCDWHCGHVSVGRLWHGWGGNAMPCHGMGWGGRNMGMAWHGMAWGSATLHGPCRSSNAMPPHAMPCLPCQSQSQQPEPELHDSAMATPRHVHRPELICACHGTPCLPRHVQRVTRFVLLFTTHHSQGCVGSHVCLPGRQARGAHAGLGAA